MGTLRVTLIALCACALAAGCKSEISGGTVDGGDEADSAVAPLIDAAVADAPSAPCVEGDLQEVNPDNGNCYWVTYTSPLNGLVARETCVLAGGHLATITSQAESDFVNALAVDAYEASLAATPVVDYYMGATDDDANSIEGVFVWVSGENFAFTNWRELEPNDNGPGDAGEDCAVIEADNGGTWDDRNCELAPPYGYICERE